MPQSSAYSAFAQSISPEHIFATCALPLGGVESLMDNEERRGTALSDIVRAGKRVMEFVLTDYVSPVDGGTYLLGLITIYRRPGVDGTLVVSSHPYQGSGCIAGGTMEEALSILYNHGLLADEHIAACLKYHAVAA